MQSIFDLTSSDLVRAFNFISKVCAAELGEINILSTDRIIRSIGADYFWDRAKRSGNSKLSMEILNAGYKRVYSIHLGEENSCIEFDFRIYISSSNYENKFSVVYLKNPRFTKDQEVSINIIIPDLSEVTESEISSKHIKIFNIINNIFMCFLNVNHDPLICGMGTVVGFDSGINNSSINYKYIKDLSFIFTLLTGLFPEEFVPADEVDGTNKDLISISDTMFRDQELIGRAREGHVIIIDHDQLLFDYMIDIGNR